MSFSETTRKGTRLDKWLWAARFYKTRTLATQAVSAGRVWVNHVQGKPARIIALGDEITVKRPGWSITVVVLAVSEIRGPASQAAFLYQETDQSREQREYWAEQRRLAPEPASTLTTGRPTKRARRKMDQWRGRD